MPAGSTSPDNIDTSGDQRTESIGLPDLERDSWAGANDPTVSMHSAAT